MPSMFRRMQIATFWRMAERLSRAPRICCWQRRRACACVRLVWALALLKQVDYGRAKVPMAPLVWGERETMHQMVWYTVILVVLTLLPVLFGAFGTLYLASAIVLNALLAGGIAKMLLAARAGKPWSGPAWWVYKYSLLYLALLFLAMAVDRAIAR